MGVEGLGLKMSLQQHETQHVMLKRLHEGRSGPGLGGLRISSLETFRILHEGRSGLIGGFTSGNFRRSGLVRGALIQRHKLPPETLNPKP